MKKEVKKQGRQISVLIEGQRKTTHLDKMKKVIDSEEGKRWYSKRMHTIDRCMLLQNRHFHHPWRSTCVWQYLQQ